MNNIKKIKKYIKKIIYTMFYRISYKNYSKGCIKKGNRKYIIFGTPKHGNIGDHAITIAEYKFLKDQNITTFEVSSFERYYIMDIIKENINPNDVIMINGGGFMGSQWIDEEQMIRDVVYSFPNNKVIIFPQTIYYKPEIEGQEEFKKSFEIYNAHKNLIICTREKVSYDFALITYKNAKIIFVPDIVLYLNEYKISNLNNREGILLCLRNDPEGKINLEDKENIKSICKKYYNNLKYTDTVINACITNKSREKVFKKKLEEFAESELVVTDRLHGMIFAVITKTPCIVIGNYNHKVKGVYEWIKELNYISYLEDVEKLEEYILNMNLSNTNKFIDFKSKFNELKDIIK